MGALMRLALAGGGLAAAALVFGFLVFATAATQPPERRGAKADAIVVLTGGVSRIRAAGGLLKAGRADRLLITGVNRVVRPADLRRLLDIGADLYSCCVTVDHAAQNTRGNAIQSRKWVRGHGFKRIIVVTASYHMARSLAELGRVLPEVDLIAHPVLPARFRDRPWWLDGAESRLLLAEYLKFLPSAVHFGIDRTLAIPDKAEDPNQHRAIAVQ